MSTRQPIPSSTPTGQPNLRPRKPRLDTGGVRPPSHALRVLEVIGNATLGGMETYLLNLVGQLPPDLFEFTCITPYESIFTAALRKLGCRVYIAAIEDDPRWRSIQLAVEVARLHSIDVIHAHMPKAHVLAGLTGRLTGRPVVATVHGMNITSHELGIWRMMQSHVITVCQEAYTQALAMGVPPDHLTLIHNGVDLAVFTPQKSGAAFRQSLGIPADVPLVGFVGRLEWEKGPDMFIRAAHRVHQTRPDVHFVLVGQGGMHSQLAGLVTQFRLAERVHFAGPRTDMADVYPAFDILAQTSRSEGMPLVLLEAMAAGRPIVATIVGGVREIIENELTGLVVFPGDWEGVADRLLELLAGPARLAQMGWAARQRAETLFDLRLSAQLTADLLTHLSAQPSRPAHRPEPTRTAPENA